MYVKSLTAYHFPFQDSVFFTHSLLSPLFSLHPRLFRLNLSDCQLNVFFIMFLQKLPNPKQPDHLKSAQEDAFTKVNTRLFNDISAKLC